MQFLSLEGQTYEHTEWSENLCPSRDTAVRCDELGWSPEAGDFWSKQLPASSGDTNFSSF